MNVLSYISLLYERCESQATQPPNKTKAEFRKFLVSHIEEAAFSQ